MASFFSKLFGGDSTPKAPAVSDPVEYEGFLIRAAPQPEDSQWRLAGTITQEQDDAQMERAFIRADVFTSRDEAEKFTVSKGKQIIDEQGKNLFADGAETGRV